MSEYATFRYPKTDDQVQVGRTHMDPGTWISLWVCGGALVGMLIAVIMLVLVCHH